MGSEIRHRYFPKLVVSALVCVVVALLVPQSALAAETDAEATQCEPIPEETPVFYPSIQRTYVVEKGTCGTDRASVIEILGDKIEGPGFSCEVFNSRSAGTGLAAFETKCRIGEKEVAGELLLDLGNHPDHFALVLPGEEGWLSLYTCDNPHLRLSE